MSTDRTPGNPRSTDPASTGLDAAHLSSLGALLLALGILFNAPLLRLVLPDPALLDGLAGWYVRAAQTLFVISGAALLLRRTLAGRVLGRVVFGLSLLAAVELAALVGFRITTGEWQLTRRGVEGMFDPHPYLVGVPRPDAVLLDAEGEVFVRHNSQGHRGPEVSVAKPPGVTRIVAVGGSTTYCAGVGEEETWPRVLDEYLGREVEVLNFGVPGYSSAEHLIQTAFHLADRETDVVVYYLGWNDIRSGHVASLRPDYSDFHGKSQVGNLDLDPISRNQPRSLRLLSLPLEALGLLRPSPPGTIDVQAVHGVEPTPRALEIYSRNLRSAVALARAQGIVPVFVPQILNAAMLRAEEPTGWCPFVAERDLPEVMRRYNEQLRQTAGALGAVFIGEVLERAWTDADFIDEGHFSVQGNRAFAQIVGRALSERGLVPADSPGA